MHSERNQKTPQRMVDDASSRVCFAYFNALGQLQNLAPGVELAAEQPGPPSIMQCVEVIVRRASNQATRCRPPSTAFPS